jgi:hypothetical protein
MIGVLRGAGFFDRSPLPVGKRSDGGCGQKSLPGVGCWSLERFHFEGLGLRFCFSFQTPIRASEVCGSERQFDLFVRMKGNVDAVQSIGDERLVAGSC